MTPGRKPNLIIGGVNKAGTTSLFTYLSAHPDIGASRVKETHYFSPLVRGEPLAPFEEYLEHFSHCDSQRFVLEASPHYLLGGAELGRVLSDRLGDPRIIVMLRDPVSRLLSLYRFKKSQLGLNQEVQLSQFIDHCLEFHLEDEIRRENATYRAHCYWAIRAGFYADFLSEWFEVFGDRLKVVFFEDLKDDARSLMKGLCEWLDLDDDVYSDYAFSVENKTRDFSSPSLHRLALAINWRGEAFWRKHPSLKRAVRRAYNLFNSRAFSESISESSRSELDQVFAPANGRLNELLRRKGYTDLPSWVTRGAASGTASPPPTPQPTSTRPSEDS